jgi:hypothetical protein
MRLAGNALYAGDKALDLFPARIARQTGADKPRSGHAQALHDCGRIEIPM